MKKLYYFAFTIIIVLAITSCAVTTPYEENRYILDFRPYIDQGFRIYSTSIINEPYDCLANISLEIIPGTKKEPASDIAIFNNKTKVNMKISPDELLERFVKYAKDLGANGILDMQMKTYYEGGRKVYLLSGSAVKM